MDRSQRATGEYVPASGEHARQHGLHGHHGHHGENLETSVEQRMNPVVTHETIKPTQHEEINKQVDKEIHQDHYRQKVQPIHDREVLPEKHVHNQAGVVQREYDNRDNAAVERALRNEAGRFRDERVVTDTTKTRNEAPGAQREHVHHHVHENIQPVLHKEVVQPEVVHTTVPVHEVHHERAQHHGTTTMPAVSLDEFKRHAGELGSSHTTSSHQHHQHHNTVERRSDLGTAGVGTAGVGTAGVGAAGVGAAAAGAGAHGHQSTSRSMVADAEAATGTGAGRHGVGASGTSHRGAGVGATGRSRSDSASSSDNEVKSSTKSNKPSLIDRLNPMKDADGDGKKGFMS